MVNEFVSLAEVQFKRFTNYKSKPTGVTVLHKKICALSIHGGGHSLGWL